jgi:hypothetical protein
MMANSGLSKLVMINHPAFKALPNLGQFAKNGVWEDAWKFPQHASPSPTALSDYLAGATEIAFEAFFGDAFFGARFHGEPRDVAHFSSSCVEAMRIATDGASFFAHLSQNKFLCGFGEEIVFTEIGAVNAWQTTDAMKLGLPRDALQNIDILWPTLTSAPLAHNTTHVKAIEFAGLSPIHHWFALPISSTEPPFALNRELLVKALQSCMLQEMTFPEHVYAKLKEAILGCEAVLAADVYAISFFIEDLDDDARKPTLILSYNTNTHWRKSIGHPASAEEAKWNFAYWSQTCQAFVGNADDATLRAQWINSLGLWYSDQDRIDDPERAMECGDDITRRFFELAAEIAKRLHDDGIIQQVFKRAVPILIHELEYYLEIAHITERANPPGLTKEFSNWLESLYL